MAASGKKKRRGIPELNLNRRLALRVLLNEEEYAALRAKAIAAGLRFSGFIRRALGLAP